MQRAGLVLPVVVWVLGPVSPPPKGLTLEYVATYTLLRAAIALVDQTAPPQTAPVWRRVGWLLGEIVLSGLVVRTQGTLVRRALIYLLPAGRAIFLLGERAGLAASLLVWVAYAINIAPGAWPDHLGDFPELPVISAGTLHGVGDLEHGDRPPGARTRQNPNTVRSAARRSRGAPGPALGSSRCSGRRGAQSARAGNSRQPGALSHSRQRPARSC